MSRLRHSGIETQNTSGGDRWRNEERGFSLVELMVVMIITSIILACSFVSLQHGMPGHELRATSSKLASELRLARQKAVAENNNYMIIFDPSSEIYTIWDDDRSDGYHSAGEAVRIISLPEDIEFGVVNIGASNSVTFRPNGSTDKGGFVEICNGSSHRRRVDVVKATGAVSEKNAGS